MKVFRVKQNRGNKEKTAFEVNNFKNKERKANKVPAVESGVAEIDGGGNYQIHKSKGDCVAAQKKPQKLTKSDCVK